MREDRSVLDLLTADYTFVDERLARHYGIPNVYGSQFRRVPVPDETRKGLLGKGAMLARDVQRRSDVAGRARQVDSRQPAGHAAAAAAGRRAAARAASADDGKPQVDAGADGQHRANPVCASCHKLMDPIGLALENFDASAAGAPTDAAGPIDATGDLLDGTHVDGVVQLRQALLKRPEVFVGTMTEKLLTYAHRSRCRGAGHADRPRASSATCRKQDYRFSSLVLGIVKSPAFQMRTKARASAAAVAAR